jgi:hypothetical protein
MAIVLENRDFPVLTGFLQSFANSSDFLRLSSRIRSLLEKLGLSGDSRSLWRYELLDFVEILAEESNRF